MENNVDVSLCLKTKGLFCLVILMHRIGATAYSPLLMPLLLIKVSDNSNWNLRGLRMRRGWRKPERNDFGTH